VSDTPTLGKDGTREECRRTTEDPERNSDWEISSEGAQNLEEKDARSGLEKT
jgi:hypothetical protein